ncbi:hypothetical protein KCP77_12480 [Salmonella enterica subsp. enterica]|nr:hypothetical protein KCP77_12480 [Salmonella enterica subsp. enterica]
MLLGYAGDEVAALAVASQLMKRRLFIPEILPHDKSQSSMGAITSPVSCGIDARFILDCAPVFLTRVLRMLTKINNICRRFPL